MLGETLRVRGRLDEALEMLKSKRTSAPVVSSLTATDTRSYILRETWDDAEAAATKLVTSNDPT